jgi:hypothetical protein
MNKAIDIQLDQTRLNLIEQEIFRLERVIAEQKVIVDDCDIEIEELNRQRNNAHSAYAYSQNLEELLKCNERKKVALEKEIRFNRQLWQFKSERAEIIERMKSYSAIIQSASMAPLQMTNVYKTIENISVEYDVFISHATEDKESFVNELVEELKKRNVRVWVDVLNIKWGDPLRKSIDEGLKKSHFGIVVISKHFIAKGWTQYELDGLFEKEMLGGKVILPVWHNITKKEVFNFSPTLAGRKAMTTDNMKPADIADELMVLLRGKIDNNDQVNGEVIR